MTEKNTSIRTKTRHPADFLTYIAIYVCAIISVALLLGIIIYVFAKGIRSVNREFLPSVTSVLKPDCTFSTTCSASCHTMPAYRSTVCARATSRWMSTTLWKMWP